MSMERYPRLLKDASPEFPIHFLNIYSRVHLAGSTERRREAGGRPELD